jgi:hypothetical protein
MKKRKETAMNVIKSVILIELDDNLVYQVSLKQDEMDAILREIVNIRGYVPILDEPIVGVSLNSRDDIKN